MTFYLLTIFIVNIILIKIIKDNAKNWGLVDIPNKRSIHKKAIPRGAGIAFYLAFFLSISFLYIDFFISYIWIFLAISLIFILGLLDDYYTISPKIKFFTLILSTSLLSLNNLLIYNIGTFFGEDIELLWFALPFTIFVVTGFTNALNLIDGLDGLASMISLVTFGVFFWIGYVYEDFFLIIFSISFISILIGFLLFNWYPASIFMGDSGSLLLGFIISILSIKSLAYIPAVSILFIGAIPIFDTLIVMLRRKHHARRLCTADSCHIHHILKYYFKGNVKKSVIFLVFVQILYSLIALKCISFINQEWLLAFFLLNIILLYRILNTSIKKLNMHC